MNPYWLAMMLVAANSSQKSRNSHTSSTAVRRRDVIRPRSRRDSRTSKPMRKIDFLRIAIAVALAIVFIAGLVLFAFAI